MSRTDGRPALSGARRPWLNPACRFLLVLALLSVFSPFRSLASQSLTLCVHPYLRASEIQRRFQPFISYLSRQLGIPVNLHIAKDYSDQIKMIGRSEMDISFLGFAPDVFRENKSKGIRAIERTPEISEHVFVAGKGLSPALIARIRTILLNMKNSREGREALRSIRPSVTGIVPAADGDYDNVREILTELKKAGVAF